MGVSFNSMNEGIWCVYYLILFICLMLMWRPSENAAAYAYHSELATDAQEGVGVTMEILYVG